MIRANRDSSLSHGRAYGGLFLAGLIFFSMLSIARAQTPRIARAGLVRDTGTGEFFLDLTFAPSLPVESDFKPEDRAQVLDRVNYRVSLIHFGGGGNDRFLNVDRIEFDPDEDLELSPTVGRSTVRIYLTGPVELSDGDTLTAYYVGKTFAGTELEAPMMSAVKVPDKPVETPPKAPDKRVPKAKGLVLKSAKGREDSNLYFSGEINRASGTDFSGTVDVKVQVPRDLSPTRQLLTGLDLKTSTDPKADPDSLRFGVDFQWTLGQAGIEWNEEHPISGLFWSNSGTIEAERDFDNTNAIWSSRVLLRLKNLWLRQKGGGDRAYFLFTPFLGTEIGKNLKSPVPEAEGRALARVLVGSNLYARLYQGGTSFARITLDGVYERRWPLRDEVGFRDVTVNNPDGPDMTVSVPSFFGSRPREWAELKLNFNVNEYVGFFTGYQYGELPPSYNLVDHSFRFGVLFKAKLK